MKIFLLLEIALTLIFLLENFFHHISFENNVKNIFFIF
jgi:hypothetical protein